MNDPLQELAGWVAPLLQRLAPAQKRKALFEAAKVMRETNRRRIRANKAPDGSAWQKRKKLRKAPPAIRYVYRAKDKHIRELEMTSYKTDYDRITGYDKEAGGIRTMLITGLIRKTTPQHGGSSLRQRASSGKMMQRITTAKNLKAHARSGHAAVVEFTNRAQRIAGIHHYGLRDKVDRRNPRSPEVRYPRRELLGINVQDMQAIEDILLQHISTT